MLNVQKILYCRNSEEIFKNNMTILHMQIILQVYGQHVKLLDRFAFGRQQPAIDTADRQDIYDIAGRVEDGIQVCSSRIGRIIK